MGSSEPFDMGAGLVKAMPKLRVYALSLTRDRDAADDLLQDILLKALDKQEKFQPGTNLAAWLTTMMRNEFISGRRGLRNRPHDDVSVLPIPTPARQEDGIRTRHLCKYLMLLPTETRRTLLMAGLEDMPYEQIAEHSGVEVGTVKSRISRARNLLDGAL